MISTWETVGLDLLRNGFALREGKLVFDPYAPIAPYSADMLDLVAQGNAQAGALTVWSLMWAKCGMPRVRMGHRLAASLMSTVLPPEHAAEVMMPWAAFAIGIPTGLITVSWDGTEQNLLWAHVHVDHAGDIVVSATSDDGMGMIWGSPGRPLSSLCEPLGAEDWPTASGCVPLDDQDLRAMQLVARLVMGTAICLSSPDESRRVAESHHKHVVRARRDTQRGRTPEPSWTHVLTRDVKVDARQSVRNYVSGVGRAPSTRWLTRGHWRRVAHGPGHSLRRWQQIEPYWNGPENAPIAVRSHVVEGP